MEKIVSASELRTAILQLENERVKEGQKVKEQFHLAYESVKPINLIKSTFKEATSSQDLKEQLLTTAVGITAGYVSKKIFESVTIGPFKRILGTAIMFSVTNVAERNPEAIKALGKGILKIIGEKIVERAHSAEACNNEVIG